MMLPLVAVASIEQLDCQEEQMGQNLENNCTEAQRIVE